MARTVAGLNVTKFFISLALILFIVQVGSILYADYVDETPLKLGYAFFLLIIITAITSIFVLGRRIGTLKREDIFFIIVQFIAILVLLYFMPQIVPEIFSALSP